MLQAHDNLVPTDSREEALIPPAHPPQGHSPPSCPAGFPFSCAHDFGPPGTESVFWKEGENEEGARPPAGPLSTSRSSASSPRRTPTPTRWAAPSQRLRAALPGSSPAVRRAGCRGSARSESHSRARTQAHIRLHSVIWSMLSGCLSCPHRAANPHSSTSLRNCTPASTGQTQESQRAWPSAGRAAAPLSVLLQGTVPQVRGLPPQESARTCWLTLCLQLTRGRASHPGRHCDQILPTEA